jgi:hypothetical protein
MHELLFQWRSYVSVAASFPVLPAAARGGQLSISGGYLPVTDIELYSSDREMSISGGQFSFSRGQLCITGCKSSSGVS